MLRLRQLAEQLDHGTAAQLVGGLPFDQVLDWYEWAHCLVLPSLTEGWPKAIAEGMCYGLTCIAVDQGHVARMLSDRGILLASGTAEEIADALECVAREPERYYLLAQRASDWAKQYSLDGLRVALGELLSRHWGEPPNADRQMAPPGSAPRE